MSPGKYFVQNCINCGILVDENVFFYAPNIKAPYNFNYIGLTLRPAIAWTVMTRQQLGPGNILSVAAVLDCYVSGNMHPDYSYLPLRHWFRHINSEAMGEWYISTEFEWICSEHSHIALVGANIDTVYCHSHGAR